MPRRGRGLRRRRERTESAIALINANRRTDMGLPSRGCLNCDAYTTFVGRRNWPIGRGRPAGISRHGGADPERRGVDGPVPD